MRNPVSIPGTRRPKKSLGQHFLKDRAVVERILRVAEIDPRDTVVEIGPGEGSLTFSLAERAAQVVAVELDPDLYRSLLEKGRDYPHLRLVQADAMKFPFGEIPAPFKVVANLPYYITTPVLFRLLSFREKIQSLTLMIQKEVADRMVASPGGKEFGVLSITVQFYTQPKLCFTVSRDAFFPKPNVESAVVLLIPRAAPPVSVRDTAFFIDLVRTAFTHRRKVLANALRSTPFPREQIHEALHRAGVAPDRRPETLSLEEWGAVSDILFEFKRGSC
jgi:16S rRNA (adenine1518-N6/adenine1519-N6)-dimethyltransferase